MKFYIYVNKIMMKPFSLDNITIFLFLDVLASLSRVVALAIEPINTSAVE